MIPLPSPNHLPTRPPIHTHKQYAQNHHSTQGPTPVRLPLPRTAKVPDDNGATADDDVAGAEEAGHAVDCGGILTRRKRCWGREVEDGEAEGWAEGCGQADQEWHERECCCGVSKVRPFG